MSGTPFRVGDLRALEAPPGGWAGIAALYSILHTPPQGIPALLAALRPRLAPSGVLLLAFHAGTGVLRREEMWGVPVDLDFHLLERGAVEEALARAGFLVEESAERDPYPEVEYPSRRAYLMARAA